MLLEPYQIIKRGLHDRSLWELDIFDNLYSIHHKRSDCNTSLILLKLMNMCVFEYNATWGLKTPSINNCLLTVLALVKPSPDMRRNMLVHMYLYSP